jgi:hypothetical protein
MLELGGQDFAQNREAGFTLTIFVYADSEDVVSQMFWRPLHHSVITSISFSQSTELLPVQNITWTYSSDQVFPRMLTFGISNIAKTL